MKTIRVPALIALILLAGACNGQAPTTAAEEEWEVDFFDDFDTFNSNNWQDQLLWVNEEDQCYVPDGVHGTREVSDGTLKLRVVDLGEPRPCDNVAKTGERHPDTRYVAGRIASKNLKEFVKGRWTARLRVHEPGQDGMFPAWWLLGARNNEPPVQEPDENICWPATGSGEIDIFEHHGHGDPATYAARIIEDQGDCTGDWQSSQTVLSTSLGEYHEYSVEWLDNDLIFRRDGEEVYRLADRGDDLPEPFFAILNFAKITDAPMEGEWVMEVDWVKHESRRKSLP